MGPDLSDVAVIVTAKDRPEYLERTLRSWERAYGAHHVRDFVVALGRGPAQSAQIALADSSTLPLRVRLDSKRAEASPGMHRAIGEAIDAVLEPPSVQFVILGEEDVVVSSDVLEYFSWAREEMGKDPQVLVACAHNRGGCGWDAKTIAQVKGGIEWALRDDDTDADQQAVRKLAYYNPWGWGITRQAWTHVIRPQWDWECDTGGPSDSGYDWNMATRILPAEGWLALVPDAARTQNIGEHGGVYSSPQIHPLQQASSFREHRDPGAGYRLEGES